MSFISLLFGNDVKVVQEAKGRPGRAGTTVAAPTSDSRHHATSDELQPKVTMLSTPIELVPVMGVRRNGQPRRPRERSSATTAAAPAHRDRLSLWSRLLCRPEVYDPHVEAAPLSHLLGVEDVDEAAAAAAADDADACDEQVCGAGAMGTGQGAEHVHHHHHHHVSDAANFCSPACAETEPASPAAPGASPAAASPRKAGRRTVQGVVVTSADDDEESATTVSSSCRDANSEVGDAEELEESAEVPSNDDGGSHAAEPLLHPPTFHVFDTRRCYSRRSASLSSPAAQSNLSFDAPQPSGANAVTATTQTGGGIPTTSGAALHESSTGRHQGRLISREELSKRRAQKRQQSKEAAKRAREHREAWAALVAAEEVPARAAEDEADKARTRTASRDDRGTPAIVKDTASSASVPASRLTNEAFESLRAGTQPLQLDLPGALLARLGHSTQLPRRSSADVAEQRAAAGAAAASPATRAPGAEVEGEERDDSESLCSRSSNGSSQLALDDEVINVETGLPVMYGSVLRCRDPSAPTTQTKRSRTGRGAAAPATGSVRAPAGKYPLGSRAYVERVLFAQRRQQEWALFALLTEAHRQAREAHVRLAQLYYYYVLPLLAQHQAEEEVCGLERALVQCGTGALRVYHPRFCCTTVYGDGEGGQPRLARVQPVDYQFTEYRFENEWRELILQVKAYLGIYAREDASLSTLPNLSESGGHGGGGTSTTGSVCVAATVLHSLELFERQRHTQNAAKDAEEWLAWYYYYFTPQLQRGTSAEERAAIVRSLVPAPTPAASAGEGTAADAANGSTIAPSSSSSSSGLEPHPLEREYLPLNWSRACSTAEREEVLGYRRGLKLRAIAKAVAARNVQASPSTELNNATEVNTNKGCVDAEAAAECLVRPTPTQAPRTTGTAVVTSPMPLTDLAPDAPDFPQSAREADARLLLESHSADDLDDGACRKSGSSNVGIAPLNSHDARVNDADVDEDDEDDDDEFVAAAAYQTVNAGCFGLSFFSIFD